LHHKTHAGCGFQGKFRKIQSGSGFAAMYRLIFTLANAKIFFAHQLITCITVLKAINLSPHFANDSFEKLCANISR
jgi:hypothetical protein